jgi:4-diphosphocytidyl-2-C-methyl-D-erythritol kinase
MLDTVMCNIGLYDSVKITTRKDSDIIVKFVDFDINPSDNTAFKMARILQTKYGLNGVDIYIEKGIPIKAGLGGSSVDAAGVLKLFDSIFDLKLTPSQIIDIGTQVGADVPYLCFGGFAIQNDIKKTIVKINSKVKKLKVIVLSIGNGVSTKQCFSKFDEIYCDANYEPSQNLELIDALIKGEKASFYKNINNALTKPASVIEPNIQQSLNLLNSLGARVASMTGSGSGCFGIFDWQVDTKSVVEKIKDKCSFCYDTFAF